MAETALSSQYLDVLQPLVQYGRLFLLDEVLGRDKVEVVKDLLRFFVPRGCCTAT